MRSRAVTLSVAAGAAVGSVVGVLAHQLIHPARDGVVYSGSYLPLGAGSAYASKLTISVDPPQPATHPSWALTMPLGIAAGIVLALLATVLVLGLRRRVPPPPGRP